MRDLKDGDHFMKERTVKATDVLQLSKLLLLHALS